MQNESKQMRMINPLTIKISPEASKSCLNGDCLDQDSSGSEKNNFPTLCKINSGIIGNQSKNKFAMRSQSDDETDFDIFEYDINPGRDGPDEDKMFGEKEGLALSGDYETNFGSDIVKNKDVCWAAGNIDNNELCPLTSYHGSTDSSFFNLSRDNLDSESRESFTQEWPFTESLSKVNQEHEILPKRTKDARKKQSTMEKCLTNNQSVLKGNHRSGSNKSKEVNESCAKTDQNKDYAFVCDKLDDFLDQEAELKINYEIPHLYAEHGIKLTSDEIVSRPNVNLKDEKGFDPADVKPREVSGPGKPKNHKGVAGKGPAAPAKKSVGKFKKHSPVKKGENVVVGDDDGNQPKKWKNKKKVPCRRSSRIMQISVVTKSNNTCERSLQCDLESDEVIETKTAKNPNKLVLDISNYKLVVKKFGMLLHLRPYLALNPIIRLHLEKIRSFETSIDKNWANFAASAVHVRGKPSKCQKMILPLKCCFKYKTEPVDDDGSGVEPEIREAVSDLVDRVCDNIDKEINVITKRRANLSAKGNSSSACRNGKSYPGREMPESDFPFRNASRDPEDLSVVYEIKKTKAGSDPKSKEPTNECKYPPELYQMPFNNIITKLLTKKLNELKSTQKLTHSIDKLKMFKQNVLELIKLNFIKESFMCNYINLWFAKIEKKNKYRVFLTFSLNPPLDEAINLKMSSRYSPGDLPKIVRELITKEDLFDPNDFAILYCNGRYWEIYGSVNFTMNKCLKNNASPEEKVQVFHLTGRLSSELKMLDLPRHVSDKNKNSKWWVMHMMQEYQEVLVRMNSESDAEATGRVSRTEIIDTFQSKLPGFIHFQGAKFARPLGVLVNPRLYPYFLIGPYNPDENHGLSLRLQTRFVPFEYCPPVDRVESNFFLKRFISSIIMHCWRSKMRVVGMWLYNSPTGTKTNFLEVRTKLRKASMFASNEDHNYNLSDFHLDEGLFKIVSESSLEKERTKDNKPKGVNQRIYLVPDIPNLGYITGILHPDKSITVEHPIKSGKLIKSYNIGDWLNMIMKKRIMFIPKELKIKWDIVKNADLISNHKPLDRFSLGGTHILCEKGIFYILSLTQEKIRNLGLDESVVKNIIMNNPIIQEVLILRQLAKIILMKDRCGLTMAGVLKLALREIEKLEKEDKVLKQTKMETEKEREFLCQKYIKSLDACEMDENLKKTMLAYVNRIMDGKNPRGKNKEDETFQCLEAINKFLIQTLDVSTEENSRPSCSFSDSAQTPDDDAVPEIVASDPTLDKNAKSELDCELVDKLESKIKNFYEILKKSTSDDPNFQGDLERRLNIVSEHLEKLKSNSKDAVDPINGKIKDFNTVNIASLNSAKDNLNVINNNNNNSSNNNNNNNNSNSLDDFHDHVTVLKDGSDREEKSLPPDKTSDNGNPEESCSGLKRQMPGIFFIDKKEEVSPISDRSNVSSEPEKRRKIVNFDECDSQETIVNPVKSAVILSPEDASKDVANSFLKRSVKTKIPELLSIAELQQESRERAQLVKKGNKVLVFRKRKMK